MATNDTRKRVAIVGAGVAGCYSAYRLRDAEDLRVDLYEMSERVGGRLWSVQLDGASGPVDLGGMFFSTLDENTYGLITKELKLPHSPVRWTRGHQFLRGKRVQPKDYADRSKAPFNLEGAEAGLDPDALLMHAVAKLVPNFAELWPFNANLPATRSATYQHLRTLRHNGHALYACGFWNVLNDFVSNEAYQMLTATIGSVGAFRNVNAFDALWSWMHAIGPQKFFMIDGGYQRLPKALWGACERTVGRHLQHRLMRVSRGSGGELRLTFLTEKGLIKRTVDALVLALPQRALQLIELGDGVLSDAREFARLRDNSVEGVAASKIYLKFDEAWWSLPEAAPGEDAVSAIQTDLPLQQCYHFSAPIADVLMASLADDVATSFWRGLNWAEGKVVSPKCSSALIEAACRQLALVHGRADIPAPISGVFVDWSRAPYGGGWHTWSIGALSGEVRKQIRGPGAGVYVCGEAYAERQGWVEGAINSAEMVIQLMVDDAPVWVEASFAFEH